jgi:hypothetical protein
MLKYLAKISTDIFPSVLATIIGAYIVNHYINAKPAADAPAVIVAPAQSDTNGKPADVANLPAPGVKAKGVSEKGASEKSVTEKAAAEKPPADRSAEHPAEAKAADVAPAEAASHGRTPAREKTAAKSAPAVEANSAPAAGPDANDLVRAAVERLRKSPEGKAAEARSSETKPAEARSAQRMLEPAVQEAAHTPEHPHGVTAVPSTVSPLPPPITVSTPSAQTSPPYTASIGDDDPNRLTPPADIPVPVIAPPLDLRADAGASMPRPKTNVADDMLSGMKSMFHAVLPKGATPD